MIKLEALITKIRSGSTLCFVELYGEKSVEINYQTLRYIELLKNFKSVFGTSEVELFSTPGRTEIGGNHTDHNNGRVLAAAVNLDNIAVAAKNDSNIVRIESKGYPKIEINLSLIKPIDQENFTSAAIVRGICARIKEMGYSIGGFDAVIDGGVPEGSGLSSSAAFEVLIGTIINHLFNGGSIDPVSIAQIGQYAENVFFGKPCGLMDQTACSVGGLVNIDFENPKKPVISKVKFDFAATGFNLVITDTGGHHADLNDEYAAIPYEMKSVARELGKGVLRQVEFEELIRDIPSIREKVGDRAILRALHFHGDNERVVKEVEALEQRDFQTFLSLIIESGRSSFMYNQNICPVTNIKEQGVSLGLAVSESILKGNGAWRVHGGGFAGTIQAFVPKDLLDEYVTAMENIFGKDACYKLFIRPLGSVKVGL